MSSPQHAEDRAERVPPMQQLVSRLLPRLMLLIATLIYVAVVAWGCQQLRVVDPCSTGAQCCETDADCESTFSCLPEATDPQTRCFPACRYVPPGQHDRCTDAGMVCSARSSAEGGSCVKCSDSTPCPEPLVCGPTGDCCDPATSENCYVLSSAGLPGLPRFPSFLARTAGPTYATDPNTTLTLSSEEAGARPAITLSYDFVAGELRTHYASLFLPGAFGVDLTPPLICTSDAECPGGTCTSNECVPLACASDPDCPDFGVPGETDLPGFCFTPPGGGPPACRVSCSATPSAPVGGSCPGIDNCPAGTTCTVLDDATCGCAPIPEAGRGLGALGLDIGINGTIDVLAPVRSLDEQFAFIDLDDDGAPSGEPLLMYEEATPTLAHRLTVFVPPFDDPLNPQPFIPQSARTYLILEAGVLTNPVAGGTVEPLLRLHSVDPESGGVDDGSGLAPLEASFSLPLLIASPIFADGFESGDVTAWALHRP